MGATEHASAVAPTTPIVAIGCLMIAVIGLSKPLQKLFAATSASNCPLFVLSKFLRDVKVWTATLFFSFYGVML